MKTRETANFWRRSGILPRETFEFIEHLSRQDAAPTQVAELSHTLQVDY